MTLASSLCSWFGGASTTFYQALQIPTGTDKLSPTAEATLDEFILGNWQDLWDDRYSDYLTASRLTTMITALAIRDRRILTGDFWTESVLDYGKFIAELQSWLLRQPENWSVYKEPSRMMLAHLNVYIPIACSTSESLRRVSREQERRAALSISVQALFSVARRWRDSLDASFQPSADPLEALLIQISDVDWGGQKPATLPA